MSSLQESILKRTSQATSQYVLVYIYRAIHKHVHRFTCNYREMGTYISESPCIRYKIE